ncbi:MAG TPA: hypothetical protein VNZ94_19720 [Xanthobacteraceae bacterium]|nr:hypothetical protein [Xanthobacteraceae bacterium]
MIALLTIGLGVLAAGVVTLVYGLPIKDFSFGNTLIITGAIVASTGAILTGMGILGRQLRRIADRLDAAAMPQKPSTFDWPPNPNARPERGGRPERPARTREPEAVLGDAPEEPSVEPAPLRATEPPLRRKPEPAAPMAAEPPPAEAPAKGRRNLMFSSTRRERERSGGNLANSGLYSELTPPTETPAAESMTQFDKPLAMEPSPAPELPLEPRLPPRAPIAPPPAPEAEREPKAAAPADDQPQAEPDAAKPDEKPAVTVIKSGVVEGMAYSLFSDGSMETQMPEGTMRFASLDELRAYLDQRH